MSNNLKFLEPNLQVKAMALIHAVDDLGINIKIIQTYRSLEEQAKKYRCTRSLTDIKSKEASLRKEGFDKLADILISVGAQKRPEWLKKGNLTNAGPGESKHHRLNLEQGAYSYAFDIACYDSKGKYITDGNRPEYKKAGSIGEALGLEWLGNSSVFPESAHFQLKGLPSRKVRMGSVSF